MHRLCRALSGSSIHQLPQRLFIALFIFGVGVLPAHIRGQNQYKLPSVITTFDLFWNLLTLLLVIGSITYIYHY